MNARNVIISSSLVLASLPMWAAPALPGFHRLTQPDGTVVEAQIIGDENFHYYETKAGEWLMADSKGTMRPMVIGADGRLAASGELTGKATPASVRAELKEAFSREFKARSSEQAALRIAPEKIPQTFPTTGEVTGLILLCEYQDVKLSEEATAEHYRELCNKQGLQSDITTGSVLDYFSAQSNGKFTPKFDVFGPITLPYNRAHYGMDNDIVSQFRDACLVADEKGLDFSKYDINNDGFVDFLFIIYAGYGQAQGGPYESVWPAMQDLSNYVFDYFDGLNLGVAACSCELKGNSGTNLDGIGTICHEFSHILGLADIYDTSNQGGHGMSHYDIMDVGSYNDNQITPSGYTAMDKFTLGWLEPRVLEASEKDVRLEPFDSSHESIFIVNPDNANEYYTLENRQQQGWDKGIPGHGLVISYCHYVPAFWRRNVVNAASASGYEHVCIVAADNSWAVTNAEEAGDPFPGTLKNTSFSANTKPAGLWNSTKTAFLPEITNIRETEDGAILFDFNANASGVDEIIAGAVTAVRVNGNDIIAPAGSVVFDISGRKAGMTGLPSGIYVVHTPEGTVKVAI